jgi:hypothetical protein
MSPEFLYRYAQDRTREALLEAERQRAAPPFRRRLALKFQALAEWLEPTLTVPHTDLETDLEPSLKRAL